jgi:hypothetical protein
MIIEISKTKEQWLVNGKPYDEINKEEKKFFDEFIIAMKWELEHQQHDKELKK